MENQKNFRCFFLDNTNTQPCKLRASKWFENKCWCTWGFKCKYQIKLTILILKSNLCGESNAYILVEWAVTITGAGADAATRSVNRTNKQVTLKDVEQFTYCIS